MSKRQTGMVDPYCPETAAEALARWDAWEPVSTVEMGGLGPGYEQCIHLLAFELIRALLAAGWKTPDWPKDKPGQEKIRADWDAICEPVIRRLDQANGFSGAQVGAAQNLVAVVLNQGWRAGVRKAGHGRQIMVSRTFPVAPAPPSLPEGT